MKSTIDKLMLNKVSSPKLDEPKIEIDREAMQAVITYEPQTSRVTFSISDQQGRVICTGDLSSGKGICDGKDKDMRPGVYTLVVVDGADMIKKQFKLG